MSNNPDKKEMKTKPEESSSSEKTQDKQTETTKIFCENVFHKMKNVEMGALFVGVENVVIDAKKIDTRITRGVNGLLSNVTGYFRNSIDTYRKTRK